MPRESTNIKERTRSSLREPGKYAVIFHNDDFTPMDFVVMLLISIFYKSYEEADQLMMKVHREGQAMVGVYSYDIAVTKAQRAVDLARVNGYPLRVSVKSQFPNL